MRTKRHGLLGDRPYPARLAVTVAVLNKAYEDPVDAALYENERNDVLDGWIIRHETEVPR
jgi:hypothetical protein